MADSLLNRTILRIRYYRAGLPWYGQLLRLTIECLGTLGLRVEPCHLLVERADSPPPAQVARGLDDLAIAFLDARDMAALARLPGRSLSEDQLLRRLDQGNRCVGIRYRDRIVSFIWFNLNECTFENHTLFRLRDNEAHLFDGHTIEAFRGKNLAPLIRARCHEELAKLGRAQCYSVTVLFNTPALRSKQKFGAQVVEQIIFVELFKRWRFHVRLGPVATRCV